jgi:hypothetical protein
MVTVDDGRVRRVLHVARGELIGADSDVPEEALGARLVSEGKLDYALLEPMVQAARRAGVFLGDLLTAEKLLSKAELAHALQRQALSRFENVLTMQGEPAMASPMAVPIVVRRPLGPLILETFRSRLPLEVARAVVATIPPGAARMGRAPFDPAGLELNPVEKLVLQKLEAGQDAGAVLDRASDPDATLRFMAVLTAIGSLGEETPDPVAELLKAI